jgi:hypothetical protein
MTINIVVTFYFAVYVSFKNRYYALKSAFLAVNL